ncbi:MAG: acetylxylan esterase [Bryobacteraceae bacterium]
MKGFVVLVYDPAGQGERQQAYDPRLGKSIIGGSTEQHFLNGAAAILLGQSFARYPIWDGMRALDYLASRKEVDKERIGCTGCSGGGTLTTYLSALDPRIKVAAPACSMNSFRTLFSGPVGDSEQSIPGFLAAGLDQADYVELFAPKPWLISSTEGDYFTPAGARQVYEEARNWYESQKAQDRIKWIVGPGPHGMPPVVREAIYEWMIRWLMNGKVDSRESKVELVPDHMLRASARGQVPGRDLYEVIRETALEPTSNVIPFIKKLLAENPAFGATIEAPPPGSMRRPAIIVVDTPEAEVTRLRAEGNVVIVVKPARAEGRLYSGNWLANTRAWLIGHNLPAMHASEIRRAVDLALARPDVEPTQISARADGVAGVWLLLAAVTDDRITRIELNRTPYSYRAALDNPVHRNLHDAVIPGFSLRWDLQDLVRAIQPRRVIWTDPTDWLDNVVPQPGPYRYTSSDASRN